MRRIKKAFTKFLHGKFAIPFLVSASLITGLILYLVFWRMAAHNNLMSAQAFENTVQLAFEHINDLVRSSEEVVVSNRDFFLYENEINQDLQTFEVVRTIENLVSDRPYIEKIAFYRKNGNTVITDDGVTPKEIFFEYEYSGDNKNVEFWENLMERYSTPTIIAASEYKISAINAFEHKRIFVVPKIYSLHDVGVLIFVNETSFLEYCGMGNYKGQLSFSMYDSQGELVLGDSESEPKLDTSKITGADRVKMSPLGRYVYSKWFDYEDLIFTLKRTEPMPQLILCIGIISISVLLMLSAALLYIRKNKAASDWTPVSERTAIYACMSDESFYRENESFADMISKDCTGFMLCAVVCRDVWDKQQFSVGLEKLKKDMPENGRIIVRQGNAIIILVLLQSKHEDVYEEVRACVDGCIRQCSEYSSPELVSGKQFYSMRELSAAYRRLLDAIQEKGVSGSERTVIPVLSDQFKLQLVECIAGGKLTQLVELIRNEASSAIKQGIPSRVFPFYLAHIYFEVAEAFKCDEAFVESTWKMFFESMEYMQYSFNGDAMINILQNTVVEARQNILRDPENTLCIAEVMDYINNNYTADLCLDSVAERFSMHPKQLSAFFKRNAGIGFVDYLTRVRIEKAKVLLLETNKSITEISAEVGYNTNTTFTMAFKKYTGKSPGQFREKQL